MRIDHGGGNIRVSEQFLNRTYIVARLQQMCGKRISQGMATLRATGVDVLRG